MTTSFSQLGLAQPVLKAIEALNYAEPTPIQQKAIPELLAGRDVLAAAQTGTGKTAAFALPVITRMLEHPKPRAAKRVRALILAPTRELAAQIDENIRAYAAGTSLSSALVFGGVNIKPQTEALAAGADFLVATPGRLLDHLGQQNVELDAVEFFVLDEADRMLDMGFIHDIKKIVKRLPVKRQTLMFSATFNDEIRALAQSFLHSPAEVEIARNKENTLIDQEVWLVAKKRKRELLRDLIAGGNWDQVLVFTRMKHAANRLAAQLNTDGIAAAAIHGNKSQSARTKALAGFKAHDIRVLVATDIAARGLDIEGLPHVVNYELPNVAQDYVHRIGRTGRAGLKGHAVSLVSKDEAELLAAIEKLLKKKLIVQKAVDYEGEQPEELALEDAQAERERARELERAKNARKKTSAARRKAVQSAERAAREEERSAGLSVNPDDRFEKKIARRPALSAQAGRSQANSSADNARGKSRTRKDARCKPAASELSANRAKPQGKSDSRNKDRLANLIESTLGKRTSKASARSSLLSDKAAKKAAEPRVRRDAQSLEKRRLIEERKRRAANIKSTVMHNMHAFFGDRDEPRNGSRVQTVRSNLPPELQRKLRGR